jgi:hypothetical protein
VLSGGPRVRRTFGVLLQIGDVVWFLTKPGTRDGGIRTIKDLLARAEELGWRSRGRGDSPWGDYEAARSTWMLPAMARQRWLYLHIVTLSLTLWGSEQLRVDQSLQVLSSFPLNHLNVHCWPTAM